MKKLTWGLIGIGLVVVAAIVRVKWQSNPPPPAEAVVQTERNPVPNLDRPSNTPSTSVIAPGPAVEHPEASTVAMPLPVAAPAESAPKPAVTAIFSQPLQTLVSRQASYAQKQAAWKQLQDSHQLDQAITNLAQTAKADPSAVEYPAALGQAYIQKLRTTEDTREKVMLAMQADQSFDQALNLDPSNWEARFWKASSLSYWPAEMNKSGEVIDNLVTLVEQQETQSPQPQFVQTYVLLGEQYQKAGYADDARQVWQRGARLFPDNNTLREKLAALP